MQNNNKYCLFSLRISRSFRYLFLSQDAFPFFVEQHFAAFCHPHVYWFTNTAESEREG